MRAASTFLLLWKTFCVSDFVMWCLGGLFDNFSDFALF